MRLPFSQRKLEHIKNLRVHREQTAHHVVLKGGFEVGILPQKSNRNQNGISSSIFIHFPDVFRDFFWGLLNSCWIVRSTNPCFCWVLKWLSTKSPPFGASMSRVFGVDSGTRPRLSRIC